MNNIVISHFRRSSKFILAEIYSEKLRESVSLSAALPIIELNVL